MNVSVIGVGYVGLSTAVAFAELGNKVVAADVDKEKIKNLSKGIMPIFEPGLKELVLKNIKSGNLTFTHSNKEVIDHGQIIFICVGTPPKDNWEVELGYVENVAKEIAEHMKEYKVIVHKSTVPVKTGEVIQKIIEFYAGNKVEFDVVSNPEFLREGSAIKDTLEPDRIVVGVESDRAKELMHKLYSQIKAPIVFTDVKSAELIKHASNAFLATKISFINSVARICELTGADVEKVADGMGLDKRIARPFLYAGIGYGGSCFPKDSQAFIKIAEKHGYDYKLMKAVHEINEDQKQLFVEKVRAVVPDLKGKKIGMLGLAFKPNTDDMRFAPSQYIIEALQKEGAEISAYDPESMENAKKMFKNVTFEDDPYKVAADAHALLLVTEWNQFKELDLGKLKTLLKKPLIIDGRNVFDPALMKQEGFSYISVGRPDVI